ncbi:MAG: restriction endonuclease [Muribaculaceae bacterium]|nr:restriction endonuclease [Muribaculaceae bacterium]
MPEMVKAMDGYRKSPIDNLFYRLMGFFPAKEGAAYEIISTAILGLVERKNAVHNRFLIGESDTRDQIDGLMDGNVMIEAKDYTKRNVKVGRDDLQKMQGALTDLPQIEKGYFTSATDYTAPAQKYADASSSNPYQKEIVPIALRPSTVEDEKGRIMQILVRVEMSSFDYDAADYGIVFVDDAEYGRFMDYLSRSGIAKLEMQISHFYNSDGEIVETIENISRCQLRDIPFEATVAEGVFDISAYIKHDGNLFAIRGIHYRIPMFKTIESFTVKVNGNATMLIKSERLGIDKLITDIEMKDAIARVLKECNTL